MHKRFVLAALPAFFAAIIAASLAHADVFTWVDANGRTHVSNLDPPDGVKVTGRVHMNVEKQAAATEAAREALREREIEALAERVRQLQNEVDARRYAPPQVEYRVIAPPPAPPSYGAEWSAPPAPAYASAPMSNGCDPFWSGCASWWGPGIYSSLVVTRPAHYRRGNPGHGGRPGSPGARPPVGGPPAMRPPGVGGGGRMR